MSEMGKARFAGVESKKSGKREKLRKQNAEDCPKCPKRRKGFLCVSVPLWLSIVQNEWKWCPECIGSEKSCKTGKSSPEWLCNFVRLILTTEYWLLTSGCSTAQCLTEVFAGDENFHFGEFLTHRGGDFFRMGEIAADSENGGAAAGHFRTQRAVRH